MNNTNKKALYPLEYQGKMWYKKDCDPIFVAYYQSVHALGWDKSVYVANDLGRILPDGEWSNDY